MATASDDVPLDYKAKRMRDLLASFYTPDPATASAVASKAVTLDAINTTSFDPRQYMTMLARNSNLEGLLQRHVQLATEIKNLDTDLQMLVYENYNKFISATDAIKRMNGNIVGMESNMEQLLDQILAVQSRSDGVNAYLFEKREHIESVHRTRNLLRKVQFIYDLPARLKKCIKSEAYADAVRFYIGATPIFKAYGDTSFRDCKRASEEAMAIITKELQGKVFSDSETIHKRAEAAVLLKQLEFPVDHLKEKLIGKLEQSIGDVQLKVEQLANVTTESNDISVPVTLHADSVREFTEAVCAYRVIFPDSEKQLTKLAEDLIVRHFESAEQYVKQQLSSANLLEVLRIIWTDVLLMDEVLPDAILTEFALEAARSTVKQFVASRFSYLLQEILEALTKINAGTKETAEENQLQVALEASKKALLQGSMNVIVEFRQLLDDDLGLLGRLTDSISDWVQEGFQGLFRTLDGHFLSLSGKVNLSSQDQELTDGTCVEKALPGLVLVLAQLSVYIEQIAIPRITEEIGASFSGGGGQRYQDGPAFVPGEIIRMFRTTSEKLLHHYINMKMHSISALLRKRLTTPNWVKHKEPREVHMFVDLFLQELGIIRSEAKQILPQGIVRKHRRSDSNGSNTTSSSRGNPLRDDKLNRSNTQRARSQLLETHLAKLFKQKVEIFTKVEYTQESVVTTIVKLSLKTFQEYVRLQTLNRSGFQQIQVDVQFLRSPLREPVEDETIVDFLLDEVIVAASERCLDPIPLEPPILERLVQAKLGK